MRKSAARKLPGGLTGRRMTRPPAPRLPPSPLVIFATSKFRRKRVLTHFEKKNFENFFWGWGVDTPTPDMAHMLSRDPESLSLCSDAEKVALFSRYSQI